MRSETVQNVVHQYRFAPNGPALQFQGALTFAEAGALWSELKSHLETVEHGQQVDFDMSKVDAVDGGAMALLVQLRAELHRKGAKSEFVGADDRVQKLIHLYRGDVKVGRLARRRYEGTLSQIGRTTLAMLMELKNVFDFFGHMLVSLVGVLRHPRTANWREIFPVMERAGADAVPIVLLINFIVGFVMAFQGAGQLKQFGANIYVANLVGISVTRELGPLMTAIVLSGRSGAAFAAEIGTMAVSEEIDALRTLGFGPMRYLVFPRVIALMLITPMLVLFGDAVGIVGGLSVGVMTLDLTPAGYWSQTLKSVELWDVLSGVMKSVIFAAVIAMISCQQGLATNGGAAEVGKRTTSSVVTILFSLILVDAAFTIFFYLTGL